MKYLLSPIALVLYYCIFPTVFAAIEGSARTQQLRGYQNTTKEEFVYCRLTIVDTLYGDSATKQAACIPIIDWVETDDIHPIDLPESFMSEHKEQIKSGTLLISITNAGITSDGLETTSHSDFSVLTEMPDHLRDLQASNLVWKSTMTVAIIRISTSDSTPQDSLQVLKDTYLRNFDNFASQYDACSFGKLKWVIDAENIIDVKVPKPISSFSSASALVTETQLQLKDSMNIAEVSSLADKVIMCIPPGTGSWAASAGVKHWRVQLNSNWCRSMSGSMHELGHTLGLLHSHADGIPYNDRTGYMGSGYTDSAGPKKCFNGYNSYLFGWYSSRHFDIDITNDNGKLIKLATFVDFESTASNEPVLINIDDTYYILYNRQKGFNLGTEQKEDQVTITQPTVDGTDRVAGLLQGEKFEIPNYKGLGTLIVEACETMSGSAGAEIMAVSVAIGKSLCGTSFVEVPVEEVPVEDEAPKSATPSIKSPGIVKTKMSDFLIWLKQILSFEK